MKWSTYCSSVKSEPQYAYSRYAYKKKGVYNYPGQSRLYFRIFSIHPNVQITISRQIAAQIQIMY